jgi:S1-C subfamily serine protease
LLTVKLRLIPRLRCLIICVVLSLLCSNSFASDTAVLFKEVRHGIVHVGKKIKTVGDDSSDIKWLGTGFLIDRSCTFATAKHVLKGLAKEDLVIRFQIPRDTRKVRTIPARILYEYSDRDLAFLRIDEINNKPCRSGNLHNFSLYGGQLVDVIGEEVLIVGYPVLANDDFDVPIGPWS